MDAWLARMYERYGPTYVVVAPIAVLGVLAATILPVGGLLAADYEGLDLDQFAFALGACALAGVPVCVGTYLAVRSELRALRRWAAGERGDELRRTALAASFTAHRKGCIAAIVLSLVLVAPTAVLTVSLPTDHETPMDFVELSLGAAALIVLASIAGYAMHELTLRPIRSELAGTTLGDFRFESLSTRLTGTLLLTIFLATSLGNTLAVDRDESGAGALLEAGALGLAITLVFALLLGPILSGSLLGPIRALIHGHRAVGAGKLHTAVAVTTQDELGELTESFNEMVAGLREREALRQHNTELVDELRASRARIVAGADGVRRQVERDLHDGAQQHLVMLKLKLGLAERAVAGGPGEADEILRAAAGDLDRALDELRDLARGIYPAVLTNGGLGEALRESAGQAPIPVTVNTDGAGRYRAEVEAAVYFCCVEALQNAAKHAGGEAKVTLNLSEADGRLRFLIADDGVGFDPVAHRTSTGIQNMSDRIGALSGELEVRSAPGRGTIIAGSIPVAAESR